MAVFGRKPIG